MNATNTDAPAQVSASLLRLNAEDLRALELESIPPFPAEILLGGTSEHWQKVLHKGEFVVTIYEAEPALIDISEPYPYDEFVLVLEGEVRLTPNDRDTQTYRAGETFLMPKGWLGTWHMPFKFREMIIVETKAWEVVEGEE